MLEPLFRRALVALVSRPRVLLSVGFASMSLPLWSQTQPWQQKCFCCQPTKQQPSYDTLAPLVSPRVSPLRLMFRFLELSIWLLPISLLLGLGFIGTHSTSELAPAVLARCLERCGPTFVKLGQWLATRRDLLSDAACQRLGKLQLDVQSSFSVEEEALFRRCAGAGLGMRKLDCSESIGAGCVAQVYRGEIEDGRQVAVKLRRPNIREQVAMDMSLLRFLALQVENLWPDLKWLSLQDALGSFGRHMEEQLDFRREGFNLSRFRANFGCHGVVRVPEVHHQSEDMLVMTFVGGRSLSELLAAGELCGKVRRELWDVLGQMVSKMIFQDNFVHQDLHPGNIRVILPGDAAGASNSFTKQVESPASWKEHLPGPMHGLATLAQAVWPFQGPTASFEIHLLDAGMAMSLDEQKRSFFADVVKHAVAGREELAGRAFLTVHERLGLADLAVAKEHFVSVIGTLARCAIITKPGDWSAMGFQSVAEYQGCRVGYYFTKLMQVFGGHRIRMDCEIWSLLMSLTLIEGSMHELNGASNVLRFVLPYVCTPASLIAGMFSVCLSECTNEADEAKSI